MMGIGASWSRQAILGVAMLGMAVAPWGRAQAEAEKGGAPIVSVVRPHLAKEAEVLRLTAQVTPLRQSPLAFQVGGRIAQRQVRAGDAVRKGDVLFTLDDRDYRLARDALRAQLAATESDLRNARRTLQRLKTLKKRQLASQSDIDAARTAVDKLTASRSALQAQLAQAQNRLDYTRLKAPWSGRVVRVQAEAGQVVGQGAPVVTLAREWGVEMAVPQGWRAALPERLPLTWHGISWAAQRYDAEPSADAASRTWRVRYRLPEERADVLPPWGEILPVTLRKPAASDGKGVWILPNTAIGMRQGRSYVWVVRSGRVHRLPVRVARMLSSRAWVRGRLSPQDRVVAMGVHLLHEGDRVRVRP